MIWMSPSQIRIKHAGVGRMIGGGQLGSREGEITDKGGLFLSLFRVLVSHNGYGLKESVAKAMEWLGSWQREIEEGVHKAKGLIEKGLDPRDLAGEIKASPGGIIRGASPVCRSLAIAIYYGAENPKELCSFIGEECSWSQPDEETRSAAAQTGLLLGLLVDGMERSRETFLKAEELLLETDMDLYPVITDPYSWAPDPDKPVPLDPVGIASMAVHFSFTKDSFENAVNSIVQLGGPSDASGLIAGALAGAYFGAGSIPEEWWRKVREVPKARALALKSLDK